MITEIAPVIRTITVAVPPERAFALFTDEIGEWWPLPGHSVYDERSRTVVFEARLGGRVYEVSVDGEEAHWADVVEFDPPHRIVLAWQPNPERPATTTVEILLQARDSGTEVKIVHTGWERLGSQAASVRASYDSGWPTILDHFAQRLGVS